jgi:ABC-2 type transport system ATP-binding protein
MAPAETRTALAGEVPAIDVHGLVKRYGTRTVVDDVSLTQMPGRICGFLGPNGSGKTTTLRMICGLLTPDGGSGSCLGFDLVKDRKAIKRETGYMTQRFGLYEDLTIRENLDFVARIYGLENARETVDQALERLGLMSRQHQLTGALSGGWKQRLALAACVLHKPRLLLLDEPTAGVDPKARRAFWDEIHSLAATGITVLVSTHYMDEAERCHEIAYIAYGKLMARGTAEEIIAASGLCAYVATGPGADRLAPLLTNAPGVTAAAAFGATLHVCGPDEGALLAAIRPFREQSGIAWERAEPTLEDVFIHLMSLSRDNAVAA